MWSLLMEPPTLMLGDLVTSLLGGWETVWPFLVMILGFSAIIFVHELGHFAVAKWADVRVERFAIGFGREIFGFTRGETRYSFNMLPLGGYVKMLGQEDFDDKSNELKFNDDPRSFVNKSVGRRMAIVSAGVIMNTLFACLLFMIVFLIGMKAIGPRIASIEPDSPAERAGLLPGDVVKKINGKNVREFAEVMTAIFLSDPHEPIEFIVERSGEAAVPVYVKPDYRHPDATREVQRQIVGIRSGVSREILDVSAAVRSSAADVARPGDQLVEIDGVAVTDDNVSRLMEVLGHTRGPIVVERKNPKDPQAPPQRVEVTVPTQLALYPSDSRDAASATVLGLTPLVRLDQVDPDGRAFLAGLEPGDTILSWDDLDSPGSAEIAASVRDNPERDVPFVVLKSDGRLVPGAVRPKRNRNGPATIQAVCRATPAGEDNVDEPRAEFVSVRPGGIAAREGIESGDLIVECNRQPYPTSREFNRIIRQGKGSRIEVTVRKPSGRTLTVALYPTAPGSMDATHRLIADNLLQIGAVVPSIHGRPSPAAQSGIPRGARILSVDGKSVSTWPDLLAAFRTAAGSTVELGYTLPRALPGTVSFPIPHCLHTLLGVGPEARILRIDGRETIAAGERKDEELSVRYHEGTRRMLAGLVGRTQVPVEFRKNLLSPLETRTIDVTEDMVDPWLGRVVQVAGVILGDETMVLKGSNALDAVVIGLHKTYYFIVQVYQVIHRMVFSRSVSAESMSGPLGILSVGSSIAQKGFVEFLFFLAIISANLAVINFLPLPIVDGGLMVFLLIEKIKGSPVSIRVQVATQMIGIFLIIGMFVYVTRNDILRLLG